MQRARRHSHLMGSSRATIDMNSLIDLTFLLLVTFIVTLPALEQGITIKLPQAKADVLPSKENKANIITIDYEHKIYLNKVPLSLTELETELKAKVAQDPDVPVLVRGDERLEYGAVMDVVKVVYQCQVRKMALVTENK